MAILQSNGILLVDSIPTHTPISGQATLARLNNTLTFYSYNGSVWNTVRLNAQETYTGAIIPDNADLGDALQSLETAIEAISQDGNHTPVVRGDAIEDVAPTVGEVANPSSGDTADVNLTSGILEKWVYTTAWGKAFSINYSDVTITDTNSIDLVKAGANISANLKISATQVGATVTTEADGLKVSVTPESKPTGYLSKALATTALGANKKFRYLAANLDGAVQDTVAWT